MWCHQGGRIPYANGYLSRNLKRFQYGVSSHTSTRCLDCRFLWTIGSPSSNSRHARVSDSGPRSPEVELVTMLGIWTLQPGHALCARCLRIFLWRHSNNDPHVEGERGVRVGRGVATCSNASKLHAPSRQQFRTLSFLFGLFRESQQSASVERAAAVLDTFPYSKHSKPATRLNQMSLAAFKSPHPGCIVWIRPLFRCKNHVHARNMQVDH